MKTSLGPCCWPGRRFLQSPIAEVPPTFRERGRVGWMMTRERSVTLMVCGIWVGERCQVP